MEVKDITGEWQSLPANHIKVQVRENELLEIMI